MTGRSCWLVLLLAAVARGDDKVDHFEKAVRPLFIKHCFECHSADAKKLKGDLRLDTAAGTRKVVPQLLAIVKSKDPDERMPPKGRLSDPEIADLETWIKAGAVDPRAEAVAVDTKPLWSLQPVRDPAVPAVEGDWARTSIDRFVQANHERRGLKPVADADRRTLIRRATYDLLGLPPTPADVEAFLSDQSADAFAKVIDRLLASPAYGERWGRHWLDVVRYADTAGDNSDYPVPQAYRYRDWVIDAVNRDVPYPEFVRQQLAGDLLPHDGGTDWRGKLVATGYLAIARRFGSYEDDRYPWHLTIEDTIDNLGRTFLGLTINCCRCHDHKFDPLSQADYYALYGFFSSTRFPRPGIELDKVQRDFVPLAPPEEVESLTQARTEAIAALTQRIKLAEADKARTGMLADEVKSLRKLRDDVERKPPPFPTVYAVAEGATTGKRKVGNACIQLKGDPERPGVEVPRRFPTSLGGQALPVDARGSGRLELAKWIVDVKNPLTARVMVNRVWQQHFGRGLVATPSDFGRQGQPPSNPDLLDHLATRFMAGGWSLKKLHRDIMASRVYQLSSGDDADNAAIDVANEHHWRFNRRRLDAESIRDTLLVVSGSLDETPAGPHPFPHPATWNFTQHNPFKANYESRRRSVYLMTQRIQRHPFLALFDGADTNASTATRITSTTPLQALFLMNDPFIHDTAKRFAGRIVREKKEARIEQAFCLLFGRPATTDEVAAAEAYLAKASKVETVAWESLARALLLSNELVYID